MNKIHRFTTWVFLFTALSLPLQSQTPIADYSYEDQRTAAYEESGFAATWSPFLPIAALVIGAIFFGIADQNDQKIDSYGSQNGNGSMAHRGKSSSYSGSKSSHHANRHKHCAKNYTRGSSSHN